MTEIPTINSVIEIPGDFEGEIEITLTPEPLPLNSPSPEGEEG